MTQAVLVVNAGSATVKYALYAETLECLLHGTEEGASHAAMLEKVLRHVQAHDIVAAGHRVVHGGDRYSAPTLVTPAVLEQLEALAPLAPLHQPHNLAGIRAVMAQRPGLRQVACFDTAFHQSQPEVARRFALPRALHDAGVKRYGFHGLSYEYIAGKLPTISGFRPEWKVIVAHLGNGASLCAMQDGRSVASSMGFTALDGLMMGTRSGSLDPGVLLYLMDEKGMSSRDLARLLYRESGLLGVSGISHDMRKLLASDDPHAKAAIELFVYRIAREAGSLAAALGGLDALVFTGGIGEHAQPVRAAVCRALQWLGNFSVAVIPTHEEEMIARHTLRLLSPARAAPSARPAAAPPARPAAGPREHPAPREGGEALYMRAVAHQIHGWDDPVAKLEEALREGHFVLEQQRIVPLKNNLAEPDCCEVLLRFKEDSDNLLPAGGFLPLAKGYGHMERIDRWVVGTVISGCLEQRRRSPGWRTPLMWINLSDAALSSPDFALSVARQIAEDGFDGKRLCFEIAEPDLIRHPREARRLAEALRPLGCRFTVDAFGSVRPAFSELRDMTFDFVKIDGVIVQNMLRNPAEMSKVRAMHSACEQLGIRTVAEFVDDQALLPALRKVGVDYAQGFSIARPGRLFGPADGARSAARG